MHPSSLRARIPSLIVPCSRTTNPPPNSFSYTTAFSSEPSRGSTDPQYYRICPLSPSQETPDRFFGRTPFESQEESGVAPAKPSDAKRSAHRVYMPPSRSNPPRTSISLLDCGHLHPHFASQPSTSSTSRHTLTSSARSPNDRKGRCSRPLSREDARIIAQPRNPCQAASEQPQPHMAVLDAPRSRTRREASSSVRSQDVSPRLTSIGSHLGAKGRSDPKSRI